MPSPDQDNGWRQTVETRPQGKTPRICMPTARQFTKRAYQCSLYEAQDVLHEIDDVDLICLEPTWGFQLKARWQRRLIYRDVSRRLIFLNPGLKRVRLRHEYDVFVAVCQNHWDLFYINAIEGWKDRCKTSVCWLDELWAADIPFCRYWLHALRQFDHVFIGCSGTVVPLSNAIGRTCRWLPGGIDVLRFSPYPQPPPRVIDVYSIGRRWEGIHQALLRESRHNDFFYVHDTFPGMANMEPHNPAQHRELFANMAKRSRYFLVAPGKIDLPGETQGQVEVGYRYFEGAAAGAVMIGQPPHCETFSELFPWPDAVIPIQPDGSDVIEVLARLDSEPARASEIRQRNAAESLLRHDWMYRWKEIFRFAGLEPSPGMTSRERRLKSLAVLASNLVETKS